MTDQITAWASFVDDFLAGEFTQEDLIEIDVSLTIRKELDEQFEHLTAEEIDRVETADARLKAEAVEILGAIGLLEAYRNLGADAPTEEWWWHL